MARKFNRDDHARKTNAKRSGSHYKGHKREQNSWFKEKGEWM